MLLKKKSEILSRIYFEFISILRITCHLSSYLGSPLVYDCTLTVIGRELETIKAFLQPGNLVPIYLIDGTTNILHAIRIVGLDPEAEKLIKSACSKQIEEHITNEDADTIRDGVYQMYPDPADLLKHSVMFEYKGQR